MVVQNYNTCAKYKIVAKYNISKIKQKRPKRPKCENASTTGYNILHLQLSLDTYTQKDGSVGKENGKV